MDETPETSRELPELKETWKNYVEKDFNAAIESAQEFCSSSVERLRYQATTLTALSYFQLLQFDKSTELFSELAKNTTNPDDYFNLATSATLNKEIDRGKKAFDDAVEQYKKTGKNENISIPNMAFYYLHALRDAGEFEKAFEQLEFLGAIYKKLGITDSQFLYMRGVPFFEHALRAAKGVLKNIEKAKANVWINKLRESVDDEGKEMLMEFELELNQEE